MQMHLVFRLIKNHVPRPFQDLFGDFLAPVRRQAVQHDRLVIGLGQKDIMKNVV